MRSTMIPRIGLTFTDAAQQVADLARNGLHHEYAPLEDAMLAAKPVTPLDVLAVLDRLLCPEIGLVGEGHRNAPALQRVRDLLARQVEQQEGGAVLPETSNSTSNIGAMDEVFAELQSASLKPLAPDSLFEMAAERAGITIEQARACYDVFTTPLARIA